MHILKGLKKLNKQTLLANWVMLTIFPPRRRRKVQLFLAVY